MKSLLAALSFVALAAAAAVAGPVRPVVVEVYTAQGCNTCQASNAMAAKLAQKPGVLVLSLPVTYWDMFGWKDTLANEDNTRRQKAYAAALRRGGVYTPQMIIDGVRDVPATRADAVGYALEMALMARDEGAPAEAGPAMVRREGPLVAVAATRVRNSGSNTWSVGVNLSKMPEGLRVAVDRAPERRRLDATVWLFRVKTNATVRITGGESAGQTVAYKNVVTGIQNLGNWHGDAHAFAVPSPAGKVAPYDAVAVVVQQGGFGRVVGSSLQPITY
ncbi:hypothetical protein FHS83_001982 [Rhizomicrobium palustre]|uniref:DUF1223 domain-containing protein n=1 Tax=Rhizomicrobium palustre TaxID=189966 RepID=A0A846MYF5_9PROT|nr:DUF1223 domain-containing protein [Rhizomicrobium palustre]NIK88664.1 hypothetical protein [Rhizomicrobium palustre]